MFRQLTISKGQEKSKDGNSRNHSGSSLWCYEGEEKNCRGILDGCMIGSYYKIHICETSYLVC